MAGPRGLFQYVSDNGTTYKLSLDASNGAATTATASDGTHADYPGRWRPRYVLAQHPTLKQQRKIVICDPADAIWTDTGGTLTLVNTSVHPSIDTAYNLKGRVGEKRYF